MAVSVYCEVEGVGKLGTSDDWMANVLGQELFGSTLKSYVSVVDGVSRAVVELPAIPAELGVGGLASYFRAASNVALRCAYTTSEPTTLSSAGSVSRTETSTLEAHSRTPSETSNYTASSEDGGFKLDGPAGLLLNDMNNIVMARSGFSKPGMQLASGFCYETVFKPDKRQMAVAKLSHWPTLKSVLSMPSDWFESSDMLQRIGVSIRSDNIHFQYGWGDGVLTALDVMSVVSRSQTHSSVGIDTLLLMKVGGGHARNHDDCREKFLREVGLKRVAVWGSDMIELKTSPGWSLLVDNLDGDESAVEKAAISISSGKVCPCWHDCPRGEGNLVPCNNCGFMTISEGHSERCSVKKRAPNTDLKGKAWIGDAIHALDVRRVLLQVMSYNDAVKTFNKYTSAAGQHRFLYEKRDVTTAAADSSDWFEANYESIRDEYMEWLRNDVHGGVETVSRSSTMSVAVSGSSREAGSASPVLVHDESRGRLDLVVALIVADDRPGLLEYIRDRCTVQDFVLLEQALTRIDTVGDGSEVDGSCKPSKPGSLEVELFAPLVRAWFANGSMAQAVLKLVRGRNVANVSKKNCIKILKDLV